jgi:Leucine-rich repeat (LRR) protein
VSGIILLALLVVLVINSGNVAQDGTLIDDDRATSDEQPVNTPTDDGTTASPTPTERPNPGTQLNLANQGLTQLPAYVLSRRNATTLDLSYNELTGALPSEIGGLTQLRELNVSHNRMTGVPAEVGRLSKLEVLDLSYNELTGLPYELGNLSNLKQLDLRGNDYAEADLAIIREGLPESTVILTD